MHSIRRWFYRPKKEDSSKLAQFYWADEELTMVATELDSFDGRTDPDRCSILVSQLRICQDKVLSVCNEIMDDAIPDMRANRDFRAKFPDDVLHENLAGQLWFGAECLAAGSNIMNRELESANMRPLAKALTRALDNVRCLLREQSLRNSLCYSDKVKEALRIFDRLFAEFELCYVSAMVPIKSAKEYHLQQEIVVLFSETLIRALKMGLVTQDMVDDYDPSLMFTIPRLAIVWGLLLYPEGPLNVDREATDMSELFRPFCSLLFKIRDLLWTLTRLELHMLEKMLCSQEEPQIEEKSECEDIPVHSSEDYISKFYQNHSNCKQFIQDFYAYNFGIVVGEDGNQEVCETMKQNSDPQKLNQVETDCSNEEIEVKPDKIYSQKDHVGSPDTSESDVETVTSNELVNSAFNSSPAALNNNETDENVGQAHFYMNDLPASCNERTSLLNKDFENALNEEELRASIRPTSGVQNHNMTLQGCQSSFAKCDTVPENCSLCIDVIEQGMPSSAQDALCLEQCLNNLHSECTCGINASSSLEHLTPSRELLRQVMRHVEIVPPGQHIAGYSSSPESSPRAYHHGLLSHSFPAHPAYNARTPQHVPTSRWCKRRQRSSRHRSLQSRSVRFNCDISPSRHYYSCYSSNAETTNFHLCRNSPVHNSTPLTIPQVQRLRDDIAASSEHTYSSCSSCQSVSSVSSSEWDSTSPETSSYNSECQDDEEIALALQAAEIASRNKARSRFKSSGDLLHKLFVCISGVADQLQTNYASDLRNILKSVFDMNCSQSQQTSDDSGVPNSSDFTPPNTCSSSSNASEEMEQREDLSCLTDNTSIETQQEILSIEVSTEPVTSCDHREEDERDHSSVDSAEEVIPDGSPTPSLVISEVRQDNEDSINEAVIPADPPAWLPDELSAHCMACKAPFTILRRRHHCRNCGKIFCSRCSSNSIPLPRFGHLKPVRVCNQCFMYQLTSLVMQQQL